MTTGTAEAEAAQTRIQAYLDRSGLAARAARAVPLTGDASDRQYFRILVPDGPTTVLALHAGPIDYAVLPFVNVAELLARMPVPIPAIFDHADDLGVLVLEDLGDVTLQASTWRSTARRSPSSRSSSGAGPSSRPRSICRTASPSTSRS
jgi:aminoglycoside/choline kinase family phosphotransferase